MTMDEMIDELVRAEANLYSVAGSLQDGLPARLDIEDLSEFADAEEAVRALVREVDEEFALWVLGWHLGRTVGYERAMVSFTEQQLENLSHRVVSYRINVTKQQSK
jgi:hypothetical protein